MFGNNSRSQQFAVCLFFILLPDFTACHFPWRWGEGFYVSPFLAAWCVLSKCFQSTDLWGHIWYVFIVLLLHGKCLKSERDRKVVPPAPEQSPMDGELKSTVGRRRVKQNYWCWRPFPEAPGPGQVLSTEQVSFSIRPNAPGEIAVSLLESLAFTASQWPSSTLFLSLASLHHAHFCPHA